MSNIPRVRSSRTARYFRRIPDDEVLVRELDGVVCRYLGSAAKVDSGRFEGHGGAGGGSGIGEVVEGLKSNAGGVSGAAEEELRKEVGRLELENAMLKEENERLIAGGVGVDVKMKAELERCKAKVKEYERMYG